MTTRMERNGRPQVKNEEMDDIEGSESNEGVDSHHSIQEIHIAERTAATGGPSKKRICLNPKTDQTEEDPKDAETSEKEESDLEEYEEDTTTDGDRPGPSGMSKGSAEASLITEMLFPIVTIKEERPDSPASTETYNALNQKEEFKGRIRVKSEFSLGFNEHGEMRYACPACKDDNKRTITELKIHYKIDHKGKRLRMSRFSNITYSCDICGKELRNQSALKEHTEIHNNSFSCDDCGLNHKKVSDHVIHMRSHSEEGIFKCIFCEFSTEDIVKITNHLSGEHVQQSKYQCSICNKGFQIFTWYIEHENYHSGLKPFGCEFCGKYFSYSRYLSAHRTSMHRKELTGIPNIHECVICKKQYQHKNSLNVHMNSHTGNVAICDICGKILSSKEKLKFHLRTHTGYKPYGCTYCGKNFTKKPILVEHIRIHTGERPYVCEYCTKAFSQRSSLVIHIRSHTGERPYVCHVCNKGFVAKAMLNIHLRTCKGIPV